MLVEAALWFHPVVWWIGMKLVEERERACDEAVLQSSLDAETYAYGNTECLQSLCRVAIALHLRRDRRQHEGEDCPHDDGADPTETRPEQKTASERGCSDGRRIAGHSWSRPSTQVHAQSAPANPAMNIAATWQGTLHTGRDLRFVVKIAKADDGTLRATFYNIDAAPDGIPTISTTLNGSLLKLELPFGTYEGTVSADGNSITGTWRQGPNPQPLNFARATPETEWTIPQPPAPASHGCGRESRI